VSTETWDNGSTVATKIRWKLWGLMTRLRRVCPANAHLVILGSYKLLGPDRHTIFVDEGCREGATHCGACWCGRLRATPAQSEPAA
jgi:hypothetical protein